MRRNAALSLSAVVLAAAVFLTLRWCSPPPPPPPPNDYSQPGNDGGTRPPSADRDVATRVSNRGNPYTEAEHRTLNCDVVYKIGITARERAECEGYRFTNLIGRASLPISLRVNEMRCPDGCTEKVSRITWVKTECRNGNAIAQVKAEVMCRAPGGPRWPGINIASVTVTASTEVAVPGESGGFDPTDRRSEYGEDLALDGPGAPWTLTCPQSVTFLYNYEEFDRGGCDTIIDYKPYVDRAVARFTTQYYNAFFCQPPCVKPPMTVLRTEWDCDGSNSTVRVKMWVRVDCRQ